MNCREIITEKLKALGADGLANTDAECGCGIDDLIPCNSDPSGFEPAKKSKSRYYDDYCYKPMEDKP